MNALRLAGLGLALILTALATGCAGEEPAPESAPAQPDVPVSTPAPDTPEPDAATDPTPVEPEPESGAGGDDDPAFAEADAHMQTYLETFNEICAAFRQIRNAELALYATGPIQSTFKRLNPAWEALQATDPELLERVIEHNRDQIEFLNAVFDQETQRITETTRITQIIYAFPDYPRFDVGSADATEPSTDGQ